MVRGLRHYGSGRGDEGEGRIDVKKEVLRYVFREGGPSKWTVGFKGIESTRRKFGVSLTTRVCGLGYGVT